MWLCRRSRSGSTTSSRSKTAANGAASSGAGAAVPPASHPLASETWWRLYCSATHIASSMNTAMAGGLVLQVQGG